MADRFINKKDEKIPVSHLSLKRSKNLIVVAVILILVVLLFVAYSHIHYEKYPLHMPLKMVSRFGELRPDHFHMGLDISTNGKENLPVYAICDGYISRVKIEEGNTGKCLFVKQDDGIISVYGHLNQFSKELEEYVHQKQYKEHSWEQNIDFIISRFPVKKGDVIGYSGNTGHSEAPHLHFEQRDARTGISFNPQKAGILVSEYSTPDLKAVYWYDRSISIYENKAHLIHFNEGITRDKPILVNSPIVGFGITAEDKIGDKYKSNGVTKASIEEDGKTIYHLSLDSLSEIDSRSINARIDYSLWYTTGNYIQYLFRLPGDSQNRSNGENGCINLSDRKVHKIIIHYGDSEKSNSSISYFIKYEPKLKEATVHNYLIKLYPTVKQQIEKKDIRLYFPSTCFYDTVPISLKKIPYNGKTTISSIYNFGDGSIPVHNSFTLCLRSNSGLSNSLRSKTVMELTNKKNKIIVKGKWKGNWMEGIFSEMGIVQLIIDSTAPTILPIRWNNNQSFSDKECLQFSCVDDCGLKTVVAKVDGHWILLSKKSDLYTYRFDEFCGKGRHRLVIRAIDIAGNDITQILYFSK